MKANVRKIIMPILLVGLQLYSMGVFTERFWVSLTQATQNPRRFEAMFAVWAFIYTAIFLYNIFGIRRTGEGELSNHYDLYTELVDRMRNPTNTRRTVPLGFCGVNGFYFVMTLINILGCVILGVVL